MSDQPSEPLEPKQTSLAELRKLFEEQQTAPSDLPSNEADVKTAVAARSDEEMRQQKIASAKLLNQSKQMEIGQRRSYANILLSVTIVQIVAINIYFAILLRRGRIDPSESEIIKVFFISTFAQIVGLTYIVTRSLFPKHDSVIKD